MPRRKGGNIVHGLINDARHAALAGPAELHHAARLEQPRCDKLDRPDRIVFDLDPDASEDFDDRARGRAGRRPSVLRELGLTPFAMVSGSRGIHVVAPLQAHAHGRRGPRGARGTIAERVAAEHPDTLTTAWRKEKRDGRILVDVARNTYGQTVVAPYAVRALPGAPVATPLALGRGRRPGAAPAALRRCAMGPRLDERGDPWADIRRDAEVFREPADHRSDAGLRSFQEPGSGGFPAPHVYSTAEGPVTAGPLARAFAERAPRRPPRVPS